MSPIVATGRATLRSFKVRLGLVLVDREYFVDEQHRLSYCSQLLKGEALSAMEPFLGTDGINFASAEAFIQELHQIFGYLDEEAAAAHELERMKQGNREFSH